MSERQHSEVHRAGETDAATIAQLLHDFNSEYDEPTPGVPVLTKRLGELLVDRAITILLAGDPAVGFALLRLRPSLWAEANDAYLEELYVIPSQRRKGIGRALLEASIEAAKAAGANHFELTTGETDTEARALYESRGFTNREGAPDGPRMLYYELDL